MSLRSGASILDQTARDTRLHYRKDSPLGLTVEELDDRGLLDGGSVLVITPPFVRGLDGL